ncbi:MAG: tRNA1(Val) (adenine(37)-N6)-methyltransferase, partial [Aristaeellaceae bacterium]
GLRIIQKNNGFRFGMDAVLLADFARVEERDRVADFGTGTGILPLLLAGRGRGAHIDAFEIQADMADMAKRSVDLNGLTERITVHHLPVEEASSVCQPGTLDAIVCNPPYGVPGTTLLNPAQALSTARHQTEAGLTAWFRMAYRLLRGKGRFHMIYPAPRMLEAMTALSRAHLEPKRFRLIYPYADKAANLVLIEAMKDAKPMLHPEPPLIVYEQDGGMTAELKRIYHLTD